MTADRIHQMTPEEYLAMEEASETRNEFVGGMIRAMSGTSFSHLRIVRNLITKLNGSLTGKPCEVLCNDLKVKVELTGDYFYPDIVGICGPALVDQGNPPTLLNPTLLIEVLSPSTEAYDRGLKFQHYQQIPTLREYVLVSQDEPRIEIFTRGTDSAWTYRMISGMEATVEFASIGCSVALADAYRDVSEQPA